MTRMGEKRHHFYGSSGTDVVVGSAAILTEVMKSMGLEVPNFYGSYDTDG